MATIETNLVRTSCETLQGDGPFESRAELGMAWSEIVFYLPILLISKHHARDCEQQKYRHNLSCEINFQQNRKTLGANRDDTRMGRGNCSEPCNNGVINRTKTTRGVVHFEPSVDEATFFKRRVGRELVQFRVETNMLAVDQVPSAPQNVASKVNVQRLM